MNGDLIYEQGQNADYVYFMFKGSLNLFVDICFILDMIASFFTFYVDDHGV